MNINTMIAGAAAVAASFAFAATPEVTAVSMSQASGSRLVTITYSLANAPAVVTLDVQTNRTGAATDVAADWVSIGGVAVCNAQGDVWKKVGTSGTFNGTITWRPDHSWPDHVIANNSARAVVTAWATNNTPDYMVVDISASAKPNTQRYYPSVDFLPGSVLGQTGAVTNNPAYKSSMLVMRKIMAKGVTWTMGSTPTEPHHQANEATHQVTLDSNYYIGIFEVTVAQFGLIATNSTMKTIFTDSVQRGERAMDGVTFNELRNRNRTTSVTEKSRDDLIPSGDAGINPSDPPASASFLGLLRLKTGLDFDLPGEAQWEFACRAGHGDGKYGNGASILPGNTDENLGKIARYNGNSENTGNGWDGSSASTALAWNTTSFDIPAARGGTAVVGSYEPNDWGLYDMLGNLSEWCVDFYTIDISSLNGAINTSVDASYSTYHVLRGGEGNYGAAYGSTTRCRPAWRSMNGGAWVRTFIGFRVACRAGLD